MITDSVIKSLGFSKSYLKSIQVLSGRDAEDYIMNEVFNDIISRTGQFENGGSWEKTPFSILKQAVTATEVEYLVAVNADELLAVAAFSIDNISLFEIAKLPFDVFPMKDFLHLRFIAGNGKGGGATLINELMEIAETKNKMLFLNSTPNARSFYKQTGFQQSLDDLYFYWLPSSLRK